jgi:hypothetical protein
VPFPGNSRIVINQARLTSARAILRNAGDHDTFTLCMACNTLAELGTATDRELADLILAQTTAHLDRPAAAPPRHGPHPLATAAAAIAAALLVLAILHYTPARIAALVLQAEQMKDW